jgi:hypothetical protein
MHACHRYDCVYLTTEYSKTICMLLIPPTSELQRKTINKGKCCDSMSGYWRSTFFLCIVQPSIRVRHSQGVTFDTRQSGGETSGLLLTWVWVSIMQTIFCHHWEFSASWITVAAGRQPAGMNWAWLVWRNFVCAKLHSSTIFVVIFRRWNHGNNHAQLICIDRIMKLTNLQWKL